MVVVVRVVGVVVAVVVVGSSGDRDGGCVSVCGSGGVSVGGSGRVVV